MRRYKQLPNCPAHNKKANFVTLGFKFYDPKNDHKVVRILRFLRGSFVVQIYNLKVDGRRTITAAPSISQVAQFPKPKSLSLNGVVFLERCSLHFENEAYVFSTGVFSPQLQPQNLTAFVATRDYSYQLDHLLYKHKFLMKRTEQKI